MRDFSWSLLAGVALVAWMCGTVPAQDNTVTLTEGQNGASAEISKNQKLHIRLPVQGGTGFSWQLTRTPSAPVRLLKFHHTAGRARQRPGRAGNRALCV